MTSEGEKKLYPLGDTDYAVAPGETLQELLEERGMSQRELTRRAGLSPKHVNKLLHGLVPLSKDVALRLERVTGTPARLWNRLEANYRSDLGADPVQEGPGDGRRSPERMSKEPAANPE
jgi:HTH-type transcriptional regulator/antitoxin HigA